MNFNDDNHPSNHTIPDKILLTGAAAHIYQKTELLFQQALKEGVKSDTRIFSDLDRLLTSPIKRLAHKRNKI